MSRKKSGTTRKKLLAAASDVFVKNGFRDATVAEICKCADANIAAVNYYFGSKEALYQEAWRHSFTEAIKLHPQDGGVAESAPAEERLRGHLQALMARIADPNTKDFMISQMELVNPTGLLEDVMKKELIPLRDRTVALVRELLGEGGSEQQVQFCEISIISMCINPMLMQRIRQRKGRGDGGPLEIDLREFANHVIKFALAGINAIRGNGSES
jgi:AcrR family transcriptional regulator